MADRFWVGGTANWDNTAGTKWSDTSGGTGGFSVPTAADDVYFDAASGAVTCTVTASANCLSLNFTGFTGTFQMSNTLNVYGNFTLSSGMTFGATSNNLQMLAETGSWTFTSAGKTIGPVRFGGLVTGATFTLQDALVSNGSITVAIGTFTTNNFNVTATSFASSNSNTRTINLGSSTVTLSGSGSVVQFTLSSGLTLNAGTSLIRLSSTASPTLNVGGGLTFYDFSFTGANATLYQINGNNIFRNLTIAGRTSAGVTSFVLTASQTINGTLTLSAGTNATMRTFVRSDTIGTTRTLTCAAVASLTDIDLRDITIAGAAAPVSGTRLGDCKGNSGITFDAAKTVYWNLAGNNNWSATAWATSLGGTPAINNFPLAQDTAVFGSASPGTGATTTVNAAYNIGTIDMSARTSNTMTLAVGTTTPTIYGNWINGTGTTLTGLGVMTFAGRGSQTITSAGRAFTQGLAVNSPAGSVVLQDALTYSSSGAFNLNAGTFDANGYNITGGVFTSSGTSLRTISIGSGTWTVQFSGSAWTVSGSNVTVTGTGIISMTSASAKTFAGGDIQTYPAIRQGGAGTLTITGSNKFADLLGVLNSGRVQFTGGTTNIFDAFSLTGIPLFPVALGSTNTTQATLQKSTAWLMGANSTDAGNNTGLSFTAGGGIDYLSVSYINGTVVAPPSVTNNNFLIFF